MLVAFFRSHASVRHSFNSSFPVIWFSNCYKLVSFQSLQREATLLSELPKWLEINIAPNVTKNQLYSYHNLVFACADELNARILFHFSLISVIDRDHRKLPPKAHQSRLNSLQYYFNREYKWVPVCVLDFVCNHLTSSPTAQLFRRHCHWWKSWASHWFSSFWRRK